MPKSNKISRNPQDPKRNASNNREIPEVAHGLNIYVGSSGGEVESHQNSTTVTDVKNETVIKTLSLLSHYRKNLQKK